MLLTWPNGRVTFRPLTTTALPRRYASRPSLDQATARASPLPAFTRFAPSGLIVQTDVGAVRPLTYAMRFGPQETREPGACRSDGVPPPAATICTSGALSHEECENASCAPSGDQLGESSNVQSGGVVSVAAPVPSTPIVRSACGQPLHDSPVYCDSANAMRVRSGERIGCTWFAWTFVMRRSPVPSGAIAYRLSNGSAQELW